MGELQKNSLCKLTTPFAEDELLVKKMTGTEAISQLFRFELDLSSEKNDLPFEEVLGQKVTIEIDLAGDRDRFIHGVVSRFGQLDSPGTGQGEDEGGDTSYFMEVVPWTWLLTRRQDCRIFQEKSIPDIVAEVFDGLGFTDYEFRLKSSYDPLVNCVQYQETDFAFISRLLEAEGIFYFFEHEKTRHLMVMMDSVDQAPEMPNMEEALFHSSAVTTHSEDRVQAWHVEQVLQPGKYALRDYNFLDPTTDLLVGAVSNVGLADTEKFEIFDYPGDYTNLGGEGEAKLGKGDSRVRLRMEEGDTPGFTAHGKSTCRAFLPGHVFKFAGHSRADFNTGWLLVSIEHEVGQEGSLDEEEGSLVRYRNVFHCIPDSVPYRPSRRTACPRIAGPQTAVVVGPGSEEIYVDKYGRVKVQFHWDRYGENNENSSCWVRVAQGWAGKQWGMIFHPRLGQEVVVEFLEGNPDRPLITGRVYNGMNSIPYSAPTQSGILTRSTKGGSTENFNQIRFEDEKGGEEIYVHAELDMNRVVENDDSEDVGANQKSTVKKAKTVSVGGNHTESIGADMDLKVAKNRSVAIDLDLAETVSGKMDLAVAKGLSETIGEARQLTVGKANEENIGAADSKSVGENQSLDVGGSRTLNVGKSLSVKIGAASSHDAATNYTLKAKKITIEAKDELKIKVGSAEMTLKKNGDINIKGKGINIKGSGDITMKGKKIAQN